MNRPCILYAEDDSNDVYLMQWAFEQAKIANPLQIAKDGQEAIDYLSGIDRFANRDKFPMPMLVLLDFKMPRKNGIDVLSWIRSHAALRCMPAIIFSASFQESDIHEAYTKGANAYTVKPATMTDRLEWVKAFNSFWLKYNRPCWSHECSMIQAGAPLK